MYFQDIINYSQTADEHIEHVGTVLFFLNRVGFRWNLNK